MKAVNLLFPHQLFAQHEIYKNGFPIYLIEESLFFTQYAFHKQKIAFHRASMKQFEAELLAEDLEVVYIEASEARSDIRVLIADLAEAGVQRVHCIDPTDNWLEKRLAQAVEKAEIELIDYENPLFINSREDLKHFFKPGKKSFFQTTFYKQQRVKRQVLIDDEEQPVGGKWSFDGENRKKYPKGKQPPEVSFPQANAHWVEACDYVEAHFPSNPGLISSQPIFPFTREQTAEWLQQFFETRFDEFGVYEDAIVAGESILNHSVLTPMLNVGLIEPMAIVEQAIAAAETHKVPINSLEGFVRQIIGWREFIRGMYGCKGSVSRTTNYWDFRRKIPASFYDGTTGIDPVDDTIRKVLRDGYCHHIERLMVLGNFMLLCEFDPDEVYRWFMELFIDAYDWVMVPNVYGMSQFADGGLFATKPYISGSNYILKMSNHSRGDWQKTWDGLFWRFMDLHRDFFLKNPRLGMLVGTFDKMDSEKKATLRGDAEKFLTALDEKA